MKKICTNCECEYDTIYKNKSKFCSSKCKSEYRWKTRKENLRIEKFIMKWSKKIKVIEYLGGKCKICGDKNIFHLTCHHRVCDEKEFEISDFIKNRWSEIEKELQKCDLLCNNCHRELHYNMNEETLTKGGIERRENKKIFIEFKGNKCEICGYDKCNSSLIFHHIKGEKDFCIGENGKKIRSLSDLDQVLTDELNKCQLICSNCHGEIHSEIEIFEKYKDKIYEKSINLKEKSKKIDHNLVMELYKSGKKQIDISKIMKCGKSSISEIIKKLKLEV